MRGSGGWAVATVVIIFFPIWLFFKIIEWYTYSRHLINFNTNAILYETAKAFKIKVSSDCFIWMPKSMISINGNELVFNCDDDFLITVNEKQSGKKEYFNFADFKKGLCLKENKI